MGKGRKPIKGVLSSHLPLKVTESALSPTWGSSESQCRSPHASELAHPREEGAVGLPDDSQQSLDGGPHGLLCRLGGEAPRLETAFK